MKKSDTFRSGQVSLMSIGSKMGTTIFLWKTSQILLRDSITPVLKMSVSANCHIIFNSHLSLIESSPLTRGL